MTRGLLRRLVLKELADNGLDAGGTVRVGRLPRGGYFVQDDGPGIAGTPGDIARMFSVGRPMVSSKLVRLPTRGALGNGLRVVAGAVLASRGALTVITRNRRIGLRPETDGTTTVLGVEDAAGAPTGTRVEIVLGADIEADDRDLAWADNACEVGAVGTRYEGGTSPFWYDAAHFHELFLASGARPVRDLLSTFDGCSGAKSGKIVAEAGLGRVSCSSVDRQQAERLLDAARRHARPVKPERLGAVGPDLYPRAGYAVERGGAAIGATLPKAEIPFVVEVWAERAPAGDDSSIALLVNRTPVTQDMGSFRSGSYKGKLYINGCGLGYIFVDSPARAEFIIMLNVTTPFCEITSDGKAPNLGPFKSEIVAAVTRATRRAQRDAPKGGAGDSIKDVVLANLLAAVAKASGDGLYAFNSRQIFYALRDVVQQATGRELQEPNFQRIITDYEAEKGEIEGMYREPRGSLLHPHSGGEGFVQLGTLSVRDYERPSWTFSSILYIEKEGFSQALQAAQWPERHDCALMSSKGFTTRAARDLIDKLAEHDEPITVFCVHDADAFGTMIYQTFQEETKARGARKIKIVNLGLEPREAVEMGLPVEALEPKERNKPVADYVSGAWREWLQTNRVELNAMTMPQFIAWLDRKMAQHSGGKLIPPVAVLTEELEIRIKGKMRAAITERVLREARIDEQVAAAVAKIERPGSPELIKGVEGLFAKQQEKSWRDHIEAVAAERTKRGLTP